MLSKFVITNCEVTLPNFVSKIKSASIDFVVISASPTRLNLPNFFSELGSFFPKTFGKRAVKSS